MTQAEIDVLAEREKQREKWGDDHDDAHDEGVLRSCAVLLSAAEEDAAYLTTSPPWLQELYRKHDRRGRLVMAAAFMLAEIDRMDRR